MMMDGTYTLAFFLGPGLPRGLGAPSMLTWEFVRFIPGFGPGTPFRFPLEFGGGASRPLAVAAEGVPTALASDASGAGDGAAVGSDGVGPETLDDVDFACVGDGLDGVEGNLARSSGLRRRLTILLLRDFEVAATAVAGVVAVELAMGTVVVRC
jgi:hypothetical protein